MSTVMVITPIIIANWPAITAAVAAAVGSIGFSAVQQRGSIEVGRSSTVNREEIEVEDSDILQGTEGTTEQMVVERDGVRATFSRDARGALKLCLEGGGLSKAQLRKLGEDLIGRVTQQYAYHRIVTELKQRNMTIVDEQVTTDQTVKIRVRNW
ncbi:MAG TPA: DUF1257 domain-containing protein [Lacipirellulaceae bacterium]|jgi:hypothetical protein|nr:DUF1257 domain-containing protein [Lacipirellulaceae bacterium]